MSAHALALGLIACSEGFTTGGTAGSGATGGASSSSGAQGGNAGADSSAGGDGGDGCNADLTSSPEHCGACGHNCLGGACVASQCQPFELLTGTNDPIGVAVTDTHLYWSEQSEVRRATLPDASAPELFIQAGSRVGYLAIRGASLYWTEDAGTIHVSTLSDKQDTLTIPANGPLGVAVDDGRIVWTEYGPGNVKARGTSSPFPIVPIAASEPSPEGIVIAGGSVYWARYSGTELMRWNEGTGIQLFAAGETGPAGVAADDQFVYWGQQSADGFIRRRPFGDGAAQTLATSPGKQPTGIAVSGDAIYWADYTSNTISVLAK